MAATFRRTYQSNLVLFEYSFDYTDIIAAASGPVAAFGAAPAVGLFESFFRDKAYFLESISLKKTEDFDATGNDFWLAVSQVSTTGATVHKIPLGSLVPLSKVNTGYDEEEFGVERLLRPASLALQSPPWPLRYAEGVVVAATTAGATHTAWASFGHTPTNGAASCVYVERDSYIVDMWAHLIDNANLTDVGTVTLQPYICPDSLPPDPANFTAVATPWTTTTVNDVAAPSIEFSAGVRARPQLTDPQAFGFVPAGSFLAVRSYKVGGALNPHDADIGVRLTLSPAVGRGYAYGHGGLPYIGQLADDNHTFPVAMNYPLIHAIIDNNAPMSDLKQGAAKLIMACRPVNF